MARWVGACVTLGLIALVIDGCAPNDGAPTDAGVCWRMTSDHGQRFEAVASDVPNIERCAANLEAIRVLRLKQPSIAGAFQGDYIVARPSGIYFGPHLSGMVRALTQTEDGGLQRPALVGACLAATAHGQQSLYKAIEVAPCVKRLIETRCALATPTLSGQWSDETVSVTDSQVTLRTSNGAVLQAVRFSGCAPDVQ